MSREKQPINKFGTIRRNLLLGAGMTTVSMITANISGRAFASIVGQPENLSSSPQKTPVIGSRKIITPDFTGPCAKVYFSPQINSESLVRLYQLVNDSIYGKVAIKVHAGEPHGPNILPRDMVRALQKSIPDSNIVETNVLYEGRRHNTDEHRKTLLINGWTFCPVDILDEHGDANFPVTGGFHTQFYGPYRRGKSL